MKRRNILLIIIVVFSILFCGTLVSSAASKKVVAKGTAGKGVKWTLYSNKQMVIRGKGKIKEFKGSKKYKNATSVVIKKGISKIGCTFDSRGDGLSVFAKMRELEKVTIPNGVKTISKCAFRGCAKLKSVNIPKTVRKIDYHTFNSCYKLQNVKIYNGVTTIENYAFEYCDSLESLHLPKSVNKIGNVVFYQCENIKNMIVDSDNKTYSSKDSTGRECNAIIEKKTKTLICGFNTTIIPNNIIRIGNQAFGNYTKSRIEIPEGVKEIADYAFGGCVNLESVRLPNTLERIGKAFWNCDKLQSAVNPDINLPDSLKYMGGTFEDFENLKSITLPPNIIELKNTFADCKNLNVDNIELPESLEYLEYAFGGCKQTKIYVPQNVKYMDTSSFGEGVESITVDENNKYYDSRGNCNAIIDTRKNELFLGCKNTIIPNDIISIGDGALSDCESIINLTIPNGVIRIGAGAFGACESLMNVEIPNSVKTIGECAFGDCKSLNNIKIPSSVKEIGFQAFDGCESLTNVEIAGNSMSIGGYAFGGCPLSQESKESISKAQRNYIVGQKTNGFNLKTSKKKISLTVNGTTGVADKNIWVDTFEVYRGTKSINLKKIATKKSYSYTDSKVKKGKKYFYKIRAKIKLEDGSYCYAQFSPVKSIKCK